MPFNLTILGCSSATPTVNRHPSAQILEVFDQLLLIDCGEATQNQVLRYRIRASRIRHILISHLHGDHYLGLVGLLSTMSIQGRTDELHVYGPSDLEQLIALNLKCSQTVLNYPLVFHETNHLEYALLFKEKRFEVYTIPLQHRIATTGFLLKEVFSQKRLDIETCHRYGIPVDDYPLIKDGGDWTSPTGEVVPNEKLTRPDRQPRSYAYCSDSLYLESIIPYISGVSMLYHEATFLHNLLDRARKPTIPPRCRPVSLLPKQALVPW